jgi:hypothetical protein
MEVKRPANPNIAARNVVLRIAFMVSTKVTARYVIRIISVSMVIESPFVSLAKELQYVSTIE